MHVSEWIQKLAMGQLSTSGSPDFPLHFRRTSHVMLEERRLCGKFCLSPLSPSTVPASQNHDMLLTKLQNVINQRLLLRRRLPLLHTKRRRIPVDGRAGIK